MGADRTARLALIVLALGAAAPAAAQDAGEEAFSYCIACHSVNRSDRGLPGPNLAGVIGRKAGALPDFAYSPAFRASASAKGIVWTDAMLDRYIADPEAMIPKSAMTFNGVEDAADRRAVIGYLKAHP